MTTPAEQTVMMTSTSSLTAAAIAAGLTLVLPMAASAGGLYLPEPVVVTNGTVSAGAEALANDPSTVVFNPAGLTQLPGTQLSLGGGLMLTKIEFEAETNNIGGGDGGDQGGLLPAGSVQFSHQLSDRLTMGASLVSLSGAALDPDKDWVGRFQVEEISMLSLTAMPALAYKLTDNISIGGGPTFTYAEVEYDLALKTPLNRGRAEMEGDDFELGFQAGILFNVSEDTNIGISYRSQSDLQLGSDVTVRPVGAAIEIDMDLPLPQTVRAGITHRLNEKWTLLGTVGWEEWSDYDSQAVRGPVATQQIVRKWDDTWRVAIGAHYQLDEKWMLQGGFSYDSSPVDDEDRTADLPIDEQYRIGFGAEYKLSANQTVGGNLTFVDLGDARIEETDYTGDYDTNYLVMLGVYSKWTW